MDSWHTIMSTTTARTSQNVVVWRKVNQNRTSYVSSPLRVSRLAYPEGEKQYLGLATTLKIRSRVFVGKLESVSAGCRLTRACRDVMCD